MSQPTPGPLGWSFHEAVDDVEQQRRCFRESALQAAVMLHGEAETQAVFRDHELDDVIVDAKRFFDYIWNGDDVVERAG